MYLIVSHSKLSTLLLSYLPNLLARTNTDMNSYDVPGGIKVSSDDENLSSWFRSSLVTIFSKLDLFCIISDKVKLNNVCLSSKDAI